MTTTGKLTFRQAKRFGSGAGSATVYSVIEDGKTTGILVRQTGFDYTMRCAVWEVFAERSMRGMHFGSKVEAAQAAIAAGLVKS